MNSRDLAIHTKMAQPKQRLIDKIGGVPANPPDGEASDLQTQMQWEVASLLGRKNPRQFPGAQPISFAQQHLQELKKQDYFVCEKTDGERYLMYLTNDGSEPKGQAIYLINRKNEYYYVPNLHFPHNEDPTFRKFHEASLLDGELVEDKYLDGRTAIKFLVFDILVLDGKDLRDRPLDKRLGHLKVFVIKPLHDWLKMYPNEKRAQACEVNDKKTEFSYALRTMFEEIIPQVKQLHGNDGLIFTCKGTSYVSGTDAHILKWKPPEENTVDFLMHITWQLVEPDPGDADQTMYEDYHSIPKNIALHIFLGSSKGESEYCRVGELYLEPDEWEKMKAMNVPLQDNIVESYLDGQKRWRFHRFRDDKAEANHISTYESVKQSIEDHVTEEDLLRHADEIRSAWKARSQKGPRPS